MQPQLSRGRLAEIGAGIVPKAPATNMDENTTTFLNVARWVKCLA